LRRIVLIQHTDTGDAALLQAVAERTGGDDIVAEIGAIKQAGVALEHAGVSHRLQRVGGEFHFCGPWRRRALRSRGRSGAKHGGGHAWILQEMLVRRESSVLLPVRVAHQVSGNSVSASTV
jgi:hypothetical protein